MKLKDTLSKVNWIHLAVQLVGFSVTMVGILWGVAVSKGDSRWANKRNTESEIKQIREIAMWNNNQISNHYQNKDLHMSLENRVETFVTRKEFERSQDEVDELSKTTSNSIESLRKEQAEFWAEQRAVNRQILQRLTP